MYNVIVNHRNPSRDGEYSREYNTDGYILITFDGNADGNLRSDVYADGRTHDGFLQLIRSIYEMQNDANKNGGSVEVFMGVKR